MSEEKLPLRIVPAAAGTRPIALVCDSPHSGTWYPDDFGHAVGRQALRRSEDTHVDVLWDTVPAAGGALLCAEFPRSYIDPNREETDIDVSMLSDAWPREARPSRQCTQLGNGLVWRKTPEKRAIYDRLLSAAEVQRRIDGCWRPYREALAALLRQAEAAHGGWWHLNLHSMPGNVYQRLGLPASRPVPDVVLGDRHGSTCDPGFLALVKHAFEARGLRVAVNDPYAGLELIRLSGEPARGRHSLQIEINRALYMDEATREPNAGFAALRESIGRVTDAVAAYVRDRSAPPGA
ncbi:MAG: N-formylglutamate amidohydrolase [Pseudomonadota bacterium]